MFALSLRPRVKRRGCVYEGMRKEQEGEERGCYEKLASREELYLPKAHTGVGWCLYEPPTRIITNSCADQASVPSIN